jgi:hypothetical protein
MQPGYTQRLVQLQKISVLTITPFALPSPLVEREKFQKCSFRVVIPGFLLPEVGLL